MKINIHKWPLHPYDYLVEILKRERDKKIGVNAHYFTAFCFKKLNKLPNAKIKAVIV